MKRRHLAIPALLLAVLLSLGLAGCGSDPAATGQQAGGDDYETMDLDKDFGGLTATDEPADFGEEYFVQAAAEDAAAESEDPLQMDADVQRYEEEAADPGADPADPARPRITALRLTWGQLDGSIEDIDEPFDVLDWSGMLRVDRGIVVVRRVILFERPRDHLVLPRIDRRTVAWVSHTGPHYDGLLVEIIEPPVDPAAPDTPAPNVLHLATPQVSVDLPVAELDGLDRLIPVDEQGNALQLLGHRVTGEDLCPRGFLSGLWRSAPADSNGAEGGVFMGRWTDVWGRLRGLVRGRYGVNSAGERVLFGKYITRRGRFRGLIRGTYAPGPETGHGTFRGEWVNAAGNVEGVLGGEYVLLPERPAGFFAGRWATLCDQEGVDSILGR